MVEINMDKAIEARKELNAHFPFPQKLFLPITIDTINVDIADDFANNDIRLITTTFNIRAKTNIYHPITDSKLIEKIKIKLNAWDEQKVVFEDTTIEYPITSN
jgi:hypothetical protein